METETQLEAQMNSFTSELRANEARKDPYVLCSENRKFMTSLDVILKKCIETERVSYDF